MPEEGWGKHTMSGKVAKLEIREKPADVPLLISLGTCPNPSPGSWYSVDKFLSGHSTIPASTDLHSPLDPTRSKIVSDARILIGCTFSGRSTIILIMPGVHPTHGSLDNLRF